MDFRTLQPALRIIMSTTITNTMPCPCGAISANTNAYSSYQECCQRLHSQSQLPKNALELMRSRYSAYYLGLVSYIIYTTDPHGPVFQADTKNWQDELESFCKNTQFLDLTILATELADPKRQIVEFQAKIIQIGRDSLSNTPPQITSVMHEKSLFFHTDSRWLYHSPLELDFA